MTNTYTWHLLTADQIRRKRPLLSRLLIESLDQRCLLASDAVVSLDFTPDSVASIATLADFDQLISELQLIRYLDAFGHALKIFWKILGINEPDIC